MHQSLISNLLMGGPSGPLFSPKRPPPHTPKSALRAAFSHGRFFCSSLPASSLHLFFPYPPTPFSFCHRGVCVLWCACVCVRVYVLSHGVMVVTAPLELREPDAQEEEEEGISPLQERHAAHKKRVFDICELMNMACGGLSRRCCSSARPPPATCFELF